MLAFVDFDVKAAFDMCEVVSERTPAYTLFDGVDLLFNLGQPLVKSRFHFDRVQQAFFLDDFLRIRRGS